MKVKDPLASNIISEIVSSWFFCKNPDQCRRQCCKTNYMNFYKFYCLVFVGMTSLDQRIIIHTAVIQ